MKRSLGVGGVGVLATAAVLDLITPASVGAVLKFHGLQLLKNQNLLKMEMMNQMNQTNNIKSLKN